MRKVFTLCWLTLLLSGVCYIFWQQEWKYSLPTPVPQKYQVVQTGEYIDLSSKLTADTGKPLFIHFFNPDCPCSRFNITHFNSLVRQYGDRMAFRVVLINKDKEYDSKEIQDRFDITVPVISDQSVATACGVYSTPQAAILDEQHHLYFRGNYNRSRYCTDMKSNFAQMAADSLLDHISKPEFSQYALKAYGCQLPYCAR